MSLTIHVDYGNGSFKTIGNVDAGQNMSVTGALDAARLMQPGLDFEFDETFTDRGGREVGAVTAIDGVDADADHAWGIWVNDRPVSGLRRVVLGSVSKVGSVRVEHGDVVACKLIERDD